MIMITFENDNDHDDDYHSQRSKLWRHDDHPVWSERGLPWEGYPFIVFVFVFPSVFVFVFLTFPNRGARERSFFTGKFSWVETPTLCI